jgi:hypothetical protein
LVTAAGLETVGGGEPLVYFSLLDVAVGEGGEGRHCSAEGGGKPNGAWEDSYGEQRGGLFERGLNIQLSLLSTVGCVETFVDSRSGRLEDSELSYFNVLGSLFIIHIVTSYEALFI